MEKVKKMFSLEYIGETMTWAMIIIMELIIVVGAILYYK